MNGNEIKEIEKMDIETQLINELAENGTDRARDLFLQWQEERIKAKERFIKNMSVVNTIPLLPDDGETEKWFNENIGVNSDCSASSAVYKFRLWLKDRLK